MQLRELISDDEAVSPVIGVILMVAITVILAAVIATFVLGLGDQISNTAPTASFSFDYDEGEHTSDSDNGYTGRLTIVHDGGESIRANELYVRGTASGNDDGPWDSSDTGDSSYGTGSRISAGNTLDVDVDPDDTVRVIYESQGNGNSATLQIWEGPNA